MLNLPLLKVWILPWLGIHWTVVATSAGALGGHEAPPLERVIPGRSVIVVAGHPRHIQGRISSLVTKMPVIASAISFITRRLKLDQLIVANRVHAIHRTTRYRFGDIS